MAPQESDGYFFTNDLLMHRKYLPEEHNGTRFVDRIVVPESYRNEILRVGHTIPLSGHMGSKKTVERITAHFFWPGLSFDVRKYCATCPQCQVVARKLKSKRAPLRPVDIVTEPFKKIAIDIVGELPRTTTGYRYILTIVDYATRYPEAIPLRSTSSKAVADALIQYFSRVGIPDKIVSDQGSNFMSKLMAQLYEQLGITKIKTSVYHPQANGLVERFNGTLKSMLRKFVRERVQTWDKYLPYLLFASREVPCESTGYSPFELLYGRTIPLETSTIEKSAFISTEGLYEFLVMPFGMKTPPASLQRKMSEEVLQGLDFADAYIDVEVDTPTSFLQHLVEPQRVLQRLRECKLNPRSSKCKIAMSTVDFVGDRHSFGSSH
ncbi:Transposon Ty3-I Gag-Pol polyprotein [Stylophora pistillata]|uniref:Transposon Ty3-I Gag-Pol polyprotein n=1 Tax=Stylophora pistillata TaxID=50429 RepID=A0A2B4RDA2_STYPI|nr:Transposon Ty3-I Gag-Pol polyprotein [Stylophora pistillata]